MLYKIYYYQKFTNFLLCKESFQYLVCKIVINVKHSFQFQTSVINTILKITEVVLINKFISKFTAVYFFLFNHLMNNISGKSLCYSY